MEGEGGVAPPRDSIVNTKSPTPQQASATPRTIGTADRERPRRPAATHRRAANSSNPATPQPSTAVHCSCGGLTATATTYASRTTVMAA